MNKTLNLEQLHAVVAQINSKAHITVTGSSLCGGARLHARNTRAIGMSAGYVELMIAEAYLGQSDNVYVYVGESQSMAEKILRALHEQLVAEQFTISSHKRDSIQLTNGPTFMFYGATQITTKCLKGRTINRVFCDVDLRNRSVDFVTRFTGELYPLIATDGDIV